MIFESEESQPPLKRCRDCGERKPVTQFWARQASPDGRTLYCKACFLQRTAEAYRKRERERGNRPRAFKPRIDEDIWRWDEALPRLPACPGTG